MINTDGASKIKDIPIVNAAKGAQPVQRRRPNIFLPRRSGKTMRILSLAEYFGACVICADEKRRNHLKEMCLRWNFRVSSIRTVQEIVRGDIIGSRKQDCVVDDADDVLKELLFRLSGGRIDVIAMARTNSEEADEFE